jgi:Zn-dependent protease with chaperone function
MSKSTSIESKVLREENFADLQREILAAFQGNIEPIRVPAAYRLGILLVAVVMVILPLIYIAIIGLVGYGVYYHAINHTGLLAMGTGRVRLMVALIYLAPIIIGAILILFMFKPLLSRPAKQQKPLSLSHDQQPLLFAFVERICEAVRAPKPKRIDVDCQVNASASFRRGFFSMLGNDLVLTIGLPLVAGLNLRQFAGVLAHEFGHFSQGAGMRLTYVIRAISHWFTRVVYERDEWDQKLVEWSERTDLRLGWIFYFARLFVWITRGVLSGLMMIGHAVSGYMLRQMEFDADRHEARLAGSDVFESTAHRIAALNVAAQGAYSDLTAFHREGRLGDSLPKLIMHNVSQFTPDTYAKINRLVDESDTRLLDTHPSDKDRIVSAKRENAVGIFHVEEPASILLRNFDEVSQSVTWEFYRRVFGNRLRREDIHPIDELLERQGQERETYKALHRYFQAAFRADQPLRLPTWQLEPPSDPDQAVVRLKQSREEMVQAVLKYKEAYLSLESAAGEEQAKSAAELGHFEKTAGQRLLAALQLLHIPQIAARIEDAAEWQQECARHLPALKLVNDQVESITKLGQANVILADMLDKLSQSGQDENLVESIRDQMNLIGQLISTIYDQLDSIDYTFDHAKGKVSIGEFALAELPDGENPVETYHAANALISSATMLRARLIGRLCIFAEQVESALGLEPLQKPLDKEEETPAA